MQVSLGIVFIVISPMMGMSILPQTALSDNLIIPKNSNDTIVNETLHSDYDEVWMDELMTEENDTQTTDEPSESLENLTPEALRLGPKGTYYAYVPIPIQHDGDEEDYWEEEEEMNRQSTILRGRPEDKSNKVVLPIVLVPDRVKASGSSFSEGPPRRFDEVVHDFEAEDLSPLAQQQARSPQEVAAIDFSMFGSLAPQPFRQPGPTNQRQRPKGDDFGRTAVLGPPRQPPRQQNRAPPRRRNNGRVQYNRRGPSRYIRPPPVQRQQPHRIQTRYPEQWGASHDPGVPRNYYSGSLSDNRRGNPTKKPLYSYPKDAMNIQDIISYMTSLGNADAAVAKPNSLPNSPEVWSLPPSPGSSNGRAGQHRPQFRDSTSSELPNRLRSRPPPYSFMV